MRELHPTTEGPEPWLAGRFAGLPPLLRFLCCSLEHSLGDLRIWIRPLPDDLIWRRPFPDADRNSVGSQLRHIAGSVDRLTTYARGESLREEQLTFLRAEFQPGASKQELMQAVEQACETTAAFAQSVSPNALGEPRFIGRQRLETPLGVLLAHIAEHTQRHVGQAIVLAKFANRAS